MTRLSTGNRELDAVLGGGFIPGSLVVVAGAPGSGKTVMAQQMCFAATRGGRTAAYFTSLSEPHNKLVEHLSQFDFYDQDALGDRIEFLYAGAVLGEPGDEAGLAPLIAEIRRKAVRGQPAVIVVDSSRALHDFVEPRRLRSLFYELGGGTGLTDTVLVLVGEYTAAEHATAPEFAIADAIVQLSSEPVGEMSRRWLRVLKLRGSDYIEGRHSFAVTQHGVEVYPRLERVVSPPPPRANTSRLSTGRQGIDELIGGGVPAQDSLLISGPSGVGKTVLSLQFVHTGLVAGEDCLFVSFQETPDDLLAKASAFGWNMREYRQSGHLEFIHVPPVEVNLDAVGVLIANALREKPFSRVVIDSLTELLVSREHDRLAPYVWALSALVRGGGGTLVATDEAGATLVSGSSRADISVFFDNVLRLRYVEKSDGVARHAQVAKMRRSRHSHSGAQFQITDTGFDVSPTESPHEPSRS